MDDNELLVLYEDKDITDVDEIKAHINKVIEELKTRAASAPEKSDVIEKFESRTEKWGGFYAKVDYGQDHMGYVSYDEPFAGRETFFCSAYTDMGNDLAVSFDVDTDAEDFDAAKSNAQDLITRMGIEGVRLGDIHTLSNEGNLYYVFCFERIVGERTIDYSFDDGGYTDDYEATITVPYEKIEVWMNGTELAKFYWRNPHRVIDIVNDNAAVQIDYFKALELGINQIYAKYAYLQNPERTEEVLVTITSIEFDMVRLKEKDSEYYISVPAWKIYGDAYEKRTQEMIDYLTELSEEDTNSNIDISEYISLTQYTGPNIVTVNALDGSIIDMGKGY
ncbi:MAG: hypothetical protein JXN65_11560 [Clostridia bacterium]|nr:hypothetical protein [Clostridia bacterium]